MDSSPVLRQQSQNKIRSDFMRMKNENNKMPAHPKSSKPLCAPHLSKQDIENKDPGNVGMGRKAPVRPGVSRLPVLAKSLHLQTPSDFSQSHCTWEEKPLAGKAKKKKACTRPVPFNFSQPKSSRNATENQQPLTVSQSRTGTHALQPDNNVCNAWLKTQNIHAKPAKHPATLSSNVDSTKGTGRSNGKATDKTSQLSQQSGSLYHPLSSISNKTVHQSSATLSAQAAVNAEACLDNMNLLSLKDLTKTSHESQSVPVTAQDSLSKGSADKGENFQSNHEALLSILRNEGVSATGLTSATPQSKPYNYLPQQVSVMKSRQKAAPPTGSVKSVQFYPDFAALQSILQNEGVKVGGLLGAAHRNSVRASGRGTSVYSAQRVPVRKNREEATGGPGAGAPKETPLNKCTPQRVQNTRHQPMSAMKWHLSTQQSPHADSPGLQSGKTNSQQQEEEVVQKLFADQEDEKSTNVTEKGSVKSVQFYPDFAALQSILQNEGVKVGGAVVATHRNSVCPSGRGTSIYSAQRVPVRKSRADVAGGPGAGTPKETPLNKCTPQRVHNTRHQPMSAMKWHLSTQKSLYTGSPGQQSCQTNAQQHQEEIVQKLFDDQENEQSTNVTDKNPETQAEQLPVQATTKSSCEETVERSRASSSDDEEQRIVGGQPFIQAPQRESVIFFSTGKKLLRAPRFEQQEKSAHDEQHGLVSSEQRKVERLPIHEETSSVSEPTCQINPSVQSLHRDLIVQKTCALGPAVAMLRKRFPPLEELRMDEEVATYTSVSVPVTPGFLLPRPRCGNPLAAILHFEESTRFVPIVCDLSSGPCSPQSSPLHER